MDIELNNNIKNAIILCNKGVEYINMNSFNQALNYLERAIEIFSTHEINNWYNYSILNKIFALNGLGSFDIGLNYCISLEKNLFIENDHQNLLLLMLEWAKIHMAQDNIKAAHYRLILANCLSDYKINKIFKSIVYSQIAKFYLDNSMYLQSAMFFNKALLNEDKQSINYALNLKLLADVKTILWFYDEALKNYQNALDIALKLRDYILTSQIIEAITNIYKVKNDKVNMENWQKKVIEINQLNLK